MPTFSQSTYPFNSGKVLDEAISLHDKGDFKKAKTLYRSIPRNDTNYVRALYELSLSCYSDSSYKEGLQACDEGLKNASKDYELDLLVSKGNMLDELLGHERALTFYDSVLRKYPQSQAILFNKGITLLKTDNTKAAEGIFQNLITINPYYASAHLRLANCAISQGRIVPALMSLFTYLTINPSGDHNKTCINSLNDISRVTKSVLEIVDKRTSEENTFSHAEQTLLSKIAMDAKFKLQANLDDPIVRQLQAMMEVIEYDQESQDFWMQYYVPLFKTVFEKKQFEAIVMHAFSDLNLETIQRYLKKNDKEINQVKNTLVEYLNKIRSTRVLTYSKRKNALELYHYENNMMMGTGTYSNENMVGKWTFYYPNGNIKAIGAYTPTGKKEGEWNYYYADGSKSGYDKWKEGAQIGEDTIYNKEGLVSGLAFYKEGKLQGDKKSFYAIGTLRNLSQYKEDTQEGNYIEYYGTGRKRIEAAVKNNEYHGVYQSYHANGEIETFASYKEGTLDGAYKNFHDNGQLSFEASYIAGKLEGPTKSYHTNGKIKQLRNFTNDLLEGKDEEYNNEGALISTSNYVKGKAQGKASCFDNDGILYSTLTYNNNILQEAKYFDKTGKEISTSTRRNKSIGLSVFSPQGYKLAYTDYNDKGEIVGKNQYFYASGKVKESNEYKDGALNGFSKGFYENGVKSYEIAYKDNEKNGPATYYHYNGKPRLMGGHSEGYQDGDWTEYNEKGNVITTYTYLNADLQGYYSTFYANGKLNYEEIYHLGWLKEINIYDTVGNLIHSSTLKNGNGKYTGAHFNKKKKFEGTYKDGELDGSYTSYFFDETVRVKKAFDRGLLNGTYQEFYHGGKESITGAFKLGKKVGNWKYYDRDGKMWKEENYKDGELNGLLKIFYTNGKVDREMEYKNDEINGQLKRYNEDGQLLHIAYFKDDLIYAYSYLDENQHPVALKALPGGTGKLISYYANGKKSAEIDYADGKVNGNFQLFYPNQNVMYQLKDSYGYTDGALVEYYQNGVKRSIYNYQTNTLDGPFQEFYENGKVKEEGQYYNSEKNGLFKYYDPNGKLLAQEHYYYGTLISVAK
jgi:antitoxin component YwqK of YwqJK toxin-antitoxin module